MPLPSKKTLSLYTSLIISSTALTACFPDISLSSSTNRNYNTTAESSIIESPSTDSQTTTDSESSAPSSPSIPVEPSSPSTETTETTSSEASSSAAVVTPTKTTTSTQQNTAETTQTTTATKPTNSTSAATSTKTTSAKTSSSATATSSTNAATSSTTTTKPTSSTSAATSTETTSSETSSSVAVVTPTKTTTSTQENTGETAKTSAVIEPTSSTTATSSTETSSSSTETSSTTNTSSTAETAQTTAATTQTVPEPEAEPKPEELSAEDIRGVQSVKFYTLYGSAFGESTEYTPQTNTMAEVITESGDRLWSKVQSASGDAITLDNGRVVKQNPSTGAYSYKNDSAYLLAPFLPGNEYDAQKEKVDALGLENLQYILPVTNENKVVTYLDGNSLDKIEKVYAVTNTKTETLNITSRTFDSNTGIVTLETDSGVKIQPSMRVINKDSSVVKNLLEKMKALTANDAVRSREESDGRRSFTENWQDFSENRLEEALLTLLSHDSSINQLFDDPLADTIRKQNFDLTSETNIKNFAALLNWSDRAFNYNYGTINARDFLLASGSQDMNSNKTISQYISTFSGSQSGASGLGDASDLQKNIFTGKNIKVLSEEILKNFTTYGENYSQWVKDTYAGELNSVVDTNIWDAVTDTPKRVRGQGDIIPALMTLNEPESYIIVQPAGIMFGGMKQYKNARGNNEYSTLAPSFIDQLNNFYNTINAVSQYQNTSTGKSYLDQAKEKHIIIWDLSKDSNTRQVYTMNDRYVYAFSSLFGGGLFYRQNIAAFQSGSYIRFVNARALKNFGIFAHELVHATDDRGPLFNGRPRRSAHGVSKMNAEGFARGLFEQNFGTSSIGINLSDDVSMKPEKSFEKQRITSWSYKSVDTPEKFKDYYSKLMKTLDYIDYAQAEAFMKLSVEDQNKLGYRALPTNGSGVVTEDRATNGTIYRPLSAQPLTEQVTSLDKLWDEKIQMRTDFDGTRTIMNGTGFAGYTAASIYASMWYLPHSDKGFADSNAFKYIALLFAAEDGWNGMLTYLSGTHGDLEVLRGVLNNDSITWKEWRKQRYEAAKQIDPDKFEQLVNEFSEALKKDLEYKEKHPTYVDWAKNTNALKTRVYFATKQSTNDFEKDRDLQIDLGRR